MSIEACASMCRVLAAGAVLAMLQAHAMADTPPAKQAPSQAAKQAQKQAPKPAQTTAAGEASLDAAVNEAVNAALDALRREGLDQAAASLSRRVRQRAAKMKLTPDQARSTAAALLDRLPAMPLARALHAVMPRSLVELIRAVEERDVSPEDAEAIAAYLLGLVETLQPGNLVQLDENHSHVIGREWHQIDYSGEGTTWRKRRAHWIRYGVRDFKKAEHLHRYFTAEERLPYFRRIYRPRGRMADVPPP